MQAVDNIKNSIGVSHEFIIHDNRKESWGLCHTYNHCAQKAQGKYLCFVHEDILMRTPNWGKIMIEFYASTPNCGTIGFAGGEYAPRMFMGWHTDFRQENYYHPSEQDSSIFEKISKNPLSENFSEVITLDGLFLFVSKKNWEINKFDDNFFTQFHFYDMDFTMSMHIAGFKNYVCHNINIIHLSRGTYSTQYYQTAYKFREKYKEKLPIKTQNISNLQSCKAEKKQAYLFWLYSKREGVSIKNRIKEYKISYSYRQFIITLVAIFIADIIHFIKYRNMH